MGSLAPVRDFEGHVAVVTGAGRGLGRAYALELGRRGASVVVSDVGRDADGSRADAVVAELEALGARAVATGLDVAAPDGAAAVVDLAASTFGGVSVVIHNAGFLRPHLVADLSDQEISAVLDVHLTAAIRLAREAWPLMRGKGYGRIVLTSSGSSFGHMGQANYVAAKAGVIGLARALALEATDVDIRTNCILPYAQSLIGVENPLPGADEGRIRPILNSMNSRRTPESVVPMVTYLASPACAVNGEAFSALAGRYARVMLALTTGWIADDPATVTAEAIGAHLGQITDPRGAVYPSSMEDEVARAHDALIATGRLEPVE
jgi:NAD(P)-dependent dehydrogenase (short-subunit alcohol dehydrogenase family)